MIKITYSYVLTARMWGGSMGNNFARVRCKKYRVQYAAGEDISYLLLKINKYNVNRLAYFFLFSNTQTPSCSVLPAP